MTTTPSSTTSANATSSTSLPRPGVLARVLGALPALTLVAVLTITASAEYALARTVLDLPPQIAWALPAAIDSYVLAALHTRRDVPAAITVMAGALLASMGAHLAQVGRADHLPVTWTAPLATAIMTVLVIVAWRVHVLIGPQTHAEEPQAGQPKQAAATGSVAPEPDPGLVVRPALPVRSLSVPTDPIPRINGYPNAIAQPVQLPRADPTAPPAARSIPPEPTPSALVRSPRSDRRHNARPNDLARLGEAIATGDLDSEPTVDAIRRHLQISPNYARAARAALTTTQPPNVETTREQPNPTAPMSAEHETHQHPEQECENAEPRNAEDNNDEQDHSTTAGDQEMTKEEDSEEGTHAVRLT